MVVPKINSSHGSETRNIINATIDSTNAQGKAIQDLVAKGQLTPTQYATLIKSVNGLIAKGEVSPLDINKNLGKFDASYFSNAFLDELNKGVIDATKLLPRSVTNEILADKSVDAKKADFIKESENLFNKDHDDVIWGKYTSAGKLIEYSRGVISSYIPVVQGDKFVVPHITGYNDNTVGAYYDGSKSYLSNIAAVGQDGLRKITVPDNSEIKYMRINIDSRTVDNFMLVRGHSYPSTYQAYYIKMVEGFKLNDTQKAEVEIIAGSGETPTNVISNPLHNKIIALDGDSIAYGSGGTGGYGKIIADRNNMTYENKAVNGATVTAETYSSGTKERHWISRSITGMRVDADYIILDGGVNDASLGVPIGSVTTGYTATLDDTTFCGALESTCKTLHARFPGKKIGYVIVHKMTDSFPPYYEKIKQILEKWGIPYVDLYNNVAPLNYIPYMKNTYTTNGDGWHPTVEGYEKFYVDKIESFMRTL